MKTLDWYKEKYPDDLEPTVDNYGRIKLPLWAMMYMLHASGLKSGKKRIIKKVLKREVIRAMSRKVEVSGE